MHLQESGEMYLETIYVLSKKGTVRSMDIAEKMGFSKPSVSRAVGLLKNGNYITVAKDGGIELTSAGRQIAESIYERHTFITSFLEHIGVDRETAAADACKIEHHISAKSFEALKKYVEENLL